jgi:hypothetical protein
VTTWLLFIYKVPNEPSARRVYVWRKLKGLGALLLHDSVWVLPDTARTREKLQWLAAEVHEMPGGDAVLWTAQQLFTGQAADLEAQFTAQVDGFYQAILDDLDGEQPDLPALSRKFQQAVVQDYFQSALGQHVRERLLRRRGDSEA